MFSFLSDLLSGLQSLYNLILNGFSGVARFFNWMMGNAWLFIIGLISFAWTFTRMIVNGITMAMEKLGLIESSNGFDSGKVETALNTFGDVCELINYVAPLEEAILSMSALVSLAATMVIYKLVKSWIPTL